MIAAALAIIQVQTVSVSADSMANPFAANSHVLPKNDIVLTDQTTTQQFLNEIIRQYQYSYPDFKGSVKAYTPDQYQDLKEGKKVQGITSEYLSKLNNSSNHLSVRTVSPVANPNSAPYSSVGVLSTWFSMANGVMVINSPYLDSSYKKIISNSNGTELSSGTSGGTGFSIGVDRIGTAAHMLYDGHYISGGIINFGDSQANHQGVGYGVLNRLIVPQAWINNSTATSNDYGAAIVSMKSGSMPAGLNLNTNPADTMAARSIGFPGDPQSGYELQGVMVQSSGTVTPFSEDPLGIYISQQINSYHGMSGGPLLDGNNSVIGINILAWSNVQGQEYQWGFRRMNSGVAGFLRNY
ncbi:MULTISPECIES: trypsin-like serine peptidase [Bacteria]|jgi:V8-like Glu-specific endopeptidase